MRTFGNLEAVIMDLAWSSAEPMTVRAMLGAIDREPPLAYTTVLTVMDNLHGKGYLVRERQGRAFIYRPAKSREDFAAELMSELLHDSGDRSTTLLRFIGNMDADELSRLRSALGD